MHRTMVFIDYENFDIARHNLHKAEKPNVSEVPWLDLIKFPQELCKKISPTYTLLKTFLFVPEPDDFLMDEAWRKKKFDWLKNLNNQDFFTVVSGRHVAKPIAGRDYSTRDLNDKATYFIDEKGTDINMAAHMLTKAFHNSYDTAIVVSGDTDYIPVYDILNTIGKTVVVVGVKKQNMSKFKDHTDRQMIIDTKFFNQCLRPIKNK